MRAVSYAVAGLLTAFAAPAVSTVATMPSTIAVAVLDRVVEKGQVLSEADFVTDAADLTPSQARGALRVRDAAGMEAMRRLQPGAVVRQGDLVRPQLVRRGEPVVIAIRERTLVITTSGRALSGGGAGDPVRVVALSTSRTLDGVVEGSGMVRVAGN